jgi:hypothetical protein
MRTSTSQSIQNQAQSVVAAGKRIELLGSSPAFVVPGPVGIGKVQKQKIGLKRIQLFHRFLSDGFCIRRFCEAIVQASRNIQVLEFFFSCDQCGFKTLFFGESEHCRDFDDAFVFLVVVPGDLVRLRPHSGEHRRMRGQRNAGNDGPGGPGVRALASKPVGPRHARGLHHSGLSPIEANDDNDATHELLPCQNDRGGLTERAGRVGAPCGRGWKRLQKPICPKRVERDGGSRRDFLARREGIFRNLDPAERYRDALVGQYAGGTEHRKSESKDDRANKDREKKLDKGETTARHQVNYTGNFRSRAAKTTGAGTVISPAPR